MWKSGGADRASAPEQLPPPRSRMRGPLEIVLTLAVVCAIVLLVFPLISALRVDVPGEISFGSASALTLTIANPNLTPLTNVEYTCEVSKLALADGSAVTNADALNRGDVRKIAGRRAVAGRCQTAYLVTSPLKTAEYKLTVTYHAYPWPQQRTDVYRISAQFDGKGNVTGWKLN